MKKVHIIASVAVAVALIAVIFGAWFLMLSPIHKNIETMNAELETVRTELKNAEAAAAQHEKFQAEAENVTRNLAFVKNRLEGNFSENDIYQVFNDLGAQQGLSGYNFVPLESKKYKDAKTLMEHGVEVKFKSSFHDMGDYINGAVSQQRIIVLENVKLVSNDVTAKRESLTATLTFSLYAKAPGESGNAK